ncbi:hypothetical protein [Streptomyces sp. NPDC127108]|uniref:hypothetical protein n=1 Tax=Streptomyces sp. NPDC127108 TaxID=3345361 RepID=UPI00363E7C1C
MFTDPMDGHSVVSLMGIVFVASVLAVGLTAYATVTLVRTVSGRAKPANADAADAGGSVVGAVGGQGSPPPPPALPRTLGAAASLAGAGALTVYALGALRLLAFDDTERGAACVEAENPADVTTIDRYSATYFPLRYGCHAADGTTYSVGVPEYVNPAALTLTIAAAVLAGAAAALSSGRGLPARWRARARDRARP